MPQTRFILTAGRDATSRAYAALESAFEEDGCPLANIEIDEDRDLYEVSL